VSAARFEIPDCPRTEVARLQRELGVSGPLAQVLVRRGFSEPLAARSFLDAREEHCSAEFSGIEEAVQVILDHVGRRQRITVHGDYDVDGVCATAVLVRTLRALEADVDSYLPDRQGDGYGLSLDTVERLAARGTRLLVTVDCAITAVEPVAMARAQGIEVVITDHHAPRADGVLPRAPIVHPAICGYPCPELCATAVAYKLGHALLEAAERDPDRDARAGAPLFTDLRRALERDLDLVALASIADVVPLLGENRRLVRRGLRALASSRKPGLRALMAVSGVDANRVDERSVSFALAPRLNAAGRLYRADAALELILTEDPERAGEVARELDAANRERRQVEGRIRVRAEEQIAELGERACYVLAEDGWHPGVIGIVASRLADRHRRPVVLIALHDDAGKGSGRSIERFDLLAALGVCEAHLKRFGGHRMAAGLEIERERVPDFRAELEAHAEGSLAGLDLGEVERVDAVVAGDELGMTLAEELRRLAPFGRGNPGVSLLVADATFADARPMGEGRHVRFTVHSHGARARAVAFGTGGRLPVDDGMPAQATFALEVNEWNGVAEPRLVLRRARPAAIPLADEDPRTEVVGAPAPGPSSRPARRARRERDPAVLVLFATP
jgi:single-stranded-DNA-specific exonuclease